MTVKQYLEQIKKADEAINQKQQTLDKLNALKYGSSSGGGDRVQCTVENKTNKITDRAMDLDAEITADTDALVDLKLKILREIEVLKYKPHMDMLFYRYIKGKTFMECADVMGYDIRSIFRIHKKSLEHFQRCHNNVISKCDTI